jgi:hypothetical protein
LLLVSMRNLSRRGDVIVLPVIRPEQFSGPESLFGRVIESLADYIFNCRREVYERALGSSGETLSTRLERLAATEAVTRRDAPSAPAIERDASEAASDALLSTRRGNEFDAMWRPFVSEVLETLGARKLIVPIDDADLAPQHLPWLLTDIRRLDDHEAITCVIAVNSQDLRDYLRGAALRVSGLAESSFPRVGAVVSRQIEKTLPYQNWVRLRNWRPEQRLGFRDLGDRTAPLESLLKGLGFGGLPLSARVRTPAETPNQFASAFPSRPRPLERLALELAASGSDRREDAFMLALEEHLTDALQESIDPIANPLRWTRGTDGLEVWLDLSQWKFFGEIAPGTSRTLSGSVDVGLRSGEIEYTFVRETATVARDRRRDAGPVISEDAVGAVLLLLDIEARDGFNRATIRGRPILGGENWRRLRLRVGGSETDNSFLVPPRWEGCLEFFALEEALGAVVDALGETQPFSILDFVEWFACVELWLIHELHKDPTGRSVRWTGIVKTLDPENAPRIAGQSGAWGPVRRRVATRVFSVLSRDYKVAVSGRSRSRVTQAFITWFESYFLWSLHPVIFRDDIIDLAVRSWLRTIGQAGRVSTAKAGARDSLRDRLRGAGLASWGDAVGELGERLGLGLEFDSRRRSVEAERLTRRRELEASVGRGFADVIVRQAGAPIVGVLHRQDREAVVAYARELVETRLGELLGGGRAGALDRDRIVVALCRDMLAAVRRGDILRRPSSGQDRR